MQPRDRIREFITTNFYVSQPELLTDEASLLDLGVIDSTGVLEIISFLEHDFGIMVSDAEMVPETLGSIGRITRFVERKVQSPPVAA
jgi:acyl carrier protein